MAWQVYDAFPGSYSRKGDIYGPLACKRWIADGKRYKVRHKVKPAYTDMRDADGKRADDERHAMEYARWLASRDGKAIPALPVCKVEWGGVYSNHETRNVHHWSGTKPQAVYLKRIRAVSWGQDHRVYNTRADGSRGAYLYTEFRAEFTIELPHWDWEPAPAVEETEAEFQLAAF